MESTAMPSAQPTTIFNPIQLYLLRLFSKMESEHELEEVQQVLSDYYFSKVEKRAAEISKKKGWTQTTLDAMANEHFRTPYK
ncbi:MAG: hypothetical protein J6I49_06295 [Bacteroidales bacterium]|nr:hypothetical protein [Bacteroidales bacterium]